MPVSRSGAPVSSVVMWADAGQTTPSQGRSSACRQRTFAPVPEKTGSTVACGTPSSSRSRWTTRCVSGSSP